MGEVSRTFERFITGNPSPELVRVHFQARIDQIIAELKSMERDYGADNVIEWCEEMIANDIWPSELWAKGLEWAKKQKQAESA